LKLRDFFSVVGIPANLRRCYCRLENLEKLIFANKNWLNDERMDCKTPNKLIELIDFETNL
jgi:hypothetical protein